jgi:hypothetical protein
LAFDGIQITNRGRNLLAKAEAGQTKITYTKFSAGDGKLAGQMPIALKALINEKISFPVSRLKIQNENVVVPGFEFSNQGVASGFFFREVGLWATDPDLGEILYAYANSGEGAEYIDAQNTSAVLKKLFNFELTVSNTAQVTVVVDDTIIYATPQDVADVLKKSKEYTDEQILNVKVPDASTTQKGIVQLSNDRTSTSITTVPTSQALSTAYNDLFTGSYRSRGNVPANWNSAKLEGSYTVSLGDWTGYLNYPANSYSYGKLLVLGGAGAIVQMYFTHDNPGRIYERICFNDTDWRPWTELLLTNGGDLQRILSVRLGDLGKVAGNTQDLAAFKSGTSNLTGLFIRQVRVSNGSDWTSTATDLVRRTDATDQAVLRFQGDDILFKNADSSWTSLRDLKQSVVNGKGVVAGAINGKGGNVTASNTFPELAAAITNLPVKRFASGTFNGQNAQASSWGMSISMPVSVGGLSFTPSSVFIRVRLTESDGFRQVEGFARTSTSSDDTIYGWRGNKVWVSTLRQQAGGFNATVEGSKIDAYAGGSPIAKISAYEWWAYE